MKAALNAQTLCFLYAIILGLFYGLSWDVNSCLRGARKRSARGTLLDFLWCILVMSSFFLFVLRWGMGSIRGYIVAGAMIGGALYFLSLRIIALSLFRAIGHLGKIIRGFVGQICKFIRKFKIRN